MSRPDPSPGAPRGRFTAGPVRGIAGAAALIAAGNIASRIFGQIRESVTSGLFGATGGIEAGAYALAARVPTTLYDFIVGGLVSAALVPVFAELAERDQEELGVVAGTVFTVASLLAILIAAIAWLFAPGIGTLLTLTAGSGALRDTTVSLIRWMLPATVLMASSGLMTGLLQAQRKFLLPAFATTVFNIGIISGAWLFHQVLGVRSLAIGMILGAGLQVVLQVPGLWGQRLKAGLRVRHPAVVRIGRLYTPVLLGLSFALVGTLVDAALASDLVKGAAAAIMRYATTLIQLALGIIASAVSLAALPTLSRQGADGVDLGEYRRTLALTLQVVLLLIVPATTALAALARPIVVLLFQHGQFGPADTTITVQALLFYLPSLIAAAIDQPLIFAFYARKNTLLPNLVNGIAITTYLLVAFGTIRFFGLYGLILANGMQWGIHALLMLWFADRRLGAIRGQGLGAAMVKGTIAGAIAGVAAYWSVTLPGWTVATKPEALRALLVGGPIVLMVYGLLAYILRIEALTLLTAGLRRRLGRSS